MQNFIARFFLLELITRCRSWKKAIFGATIFLSVLSTGLTAYYGKFNAIVAETIESLRHSVRYAPHLNDDFYLWHTNFGCFSAGMITAFLYNWIHERKVDLKGSKLFRCAWNLHYPVLILLFSFSYIFLTFNFERPSWWMAVCATFYRNWWGVLVGVTILGYSAGMGGVVQEFLSCKMFQLLGRTVFAYYLIHATVLRVVVGQTMYPIHMSMSYAVSILSD